MRLKAVLIWSGAVVAALVSLLYVFGVLAHSEPIRPTDEVTLKSQTIFRDGNLAVPDSVHVITWRAGVERFEGWYNVADAELDTSDAKAWFTETFSDIDGAGGDGFYMVVVDAYDTDSTLFTPWVYTFSVGLWQAGGVDLYAISGDVTAADNLEAALDGTGGITLSLGRLVIVNNSGAVAPFHVENQGAGPATVFLADGAGTGFWINSATGIAMNVQGATHDIQGNISGSVVAADTNVSGDTLARLADSSVFQGAAAGITIPEIMDSLLALVAADTVSGSLLGELLAGVAGASTHSAADVVTGILGIVPADTVAGSLLGQLVDQVNLAADTSLWADESTLIALITQQAVISGYWPDVEWINSINSDVDTVFILQTPPDTSHFIILWHAVGVSSSVDSGKVIEAP